MTSALGYIWAVATDFVGFGFGFYFLPTGHEAVPSTLSIETQFCVGREGWSGEPTRRQRRGIAGDGMDVPWVLVAHGSVTALVVVSFLCGQWPIFEGTFVQSINHFLTSGAYRHFLRLVQAACGTGARDLVLGVEQYCCDRPNPILQLHEHVNYGEVGKSEGRKQVELDKDELRAGSLGVFYVAIIGGTYFIIVQSSFKYIPGYYVSVLHRYLSIVVVSIGAILFVLTSFSDPGTITSENVSQYVSAYPFDNIIYVEKECSTCKITRCCCRAFTFVND
ncbi:hypothetical protein TRIUR3_28894 [Triticum urartu]|uniref:Uncharacterized protein n=1 Tax=Triticum urartu TaxID=4572 RepID=M7YEB5_TRIUA|nr:hypothetical protein TRIUR3_28894 [Triticum urartu]